MSGDTEPGQLYASSRDDLFLTITEIASEMRVSRMTVYRLVHEGEIRASRFGRSLRIRRSALQEYINRSEKETHHDLTDNHTEAPDPQDERAPNPCPGCGAYHRSDANHH